jgi:hypothetical protein
MGNRTVVVSSGSDAVRRKPARRAWLVAWTGGAALGVVNGAIRAKAYGRLGEHLAHQISTATLTAALAVYFWALDRRWPIQSYGDAVHIGAAWVAVTAVRTFRVRFGEASDPIAPTR